MAERTPPFPSRRRRQPTAQSLLIALIALIASRAALADPLSDARASCAFEKGDHADVTLGMASERVRSLPIDYVVIVTQENRSFDHYFGMLAKSGMPEADGWPEEFHNHDVAGDKVIPQHLSSTCLAHSPPHQFKEMHRAWNEGKMDGFVRNATVAPGSAAHRKGKALSDGHYALGYYDASDLPFYYWLANNYAISDRHFASAMAGTWPNRAFLYAADAGTLKNTMQRAPGVLAMEKGKDSTPESRAEAKRMPARKKYATLRGVPTIFDELSRRWIRWGVYSDGTPRQDALGWTKRHAGVHPTDRFFAQLKSGTLPRVSFVDPAGKYDEHPPHNVQDGEAFAKRVYDEAITSPLWSRMAVIFTYDEGGALGDHVAPPTACAAKPGLGADTQLGFRVPLIVASPYAKKHHVSHVVTEHAAVLRFIETLFNLPALTGRDANSEALMDMFDFSQLGSDVPQKSPPAGSGGCDCHSDAFDEDDEDYDDDDGAGEP